MIDQIMHKLGYVKISDLLALSAKLAQARFDLEKYMQDAWVSETKANLKAKETQEVRAELQQVLLNQTALIQVLNQGSYNEPTEPGRNYSQTETRPQPNVEPGRGPNKDSL